MKKCAFSYPMLATLKKKPFSDANYLFERKLDGIRCIVVKNDKSVVLYSRGKKKLNITYEEIAEAFKRQKNNFAIDGEIVAFEGKRTSFEKIQKRINIQNPKQVNKKIKVYFYAFDILCFNGKNLKSEPLIERKKFLKKAISYSTLIRYTSHIKKEGINYLKKACKKGWEGIIGKKTESKYLSRRSSDWVKFKCSNRQEFVIIGYTEPQGSRKGFGALLIGFYKNSQLKYAGKVGTGYNEDLLKKLSKRLKSIEISKPKIKEKIKEKNIHWVSPKLVAEIEFTEWTKDNKLRHPAFLGIRSDKKAKEVKKEG